MERNDNMVDDELEPQDELICMYLVQGWTHARVAAEIGCATKSIQRRMQDPSFASEVKRRRRAAVAATAASLEQLSTKAIATLSELLSSDDERVQIRAVDMVLQVGRNYHREELIEEEVLGRLEILESRAGIPDLENGGSR